MPINTNSSQFILFISFSQQQIRPNNREACERQPALRRHLEVMFVVQLIFVYKIIYALGWLGDKVKRKSEKQCRRHSWGHIIQPVCVGAHMWV